MTPTPVANARMYSASISVRDDWKALLAWVLTRAGLDWPVIDYHAPAPLSALWARPDLGLAMMCGLPFSRHEPRPVLVAAPVPSPARYGGRPVYFTDLVVRADSHFQSIEDTFGGTVGYTLVDSMSGGVALAHHLEPYRAQRGARLYAHAVGDLVNARGVIDALVAGTIDVGPLDSYYHDLMRSSEPAFAAQVRAIATTDAMPIPPLIATAALADDELQRLRAALAEVEHAAVLRPLRERLLLRGFAFPVPDDYDVLAHIAGRDFHPFGDM
jgi:ABC-type phosphate/phosphonate transport system substrate-binding protein